MQCGPQVQLCVRNAKNGLIERNHYTIQQSVAEDRVWKQYEQYYSVMLKYVRARGVGAKPKKPSAKLPSEMEIFKQGSK